MSELIKALGKAEAINILELLSDNSEKLHFNMIKNKLKSDSKTITRRINELLLLGLINKTKIGNKTIYSMTAKGKKVLLNITELKKLENK